MAAYGPDLDEGLPMRSVLRTVVTAAALATQPARGSVTQPHNRDRILGRRLIWVEHPLNFVVECRSNRCRRLDASRPGSRQTSG
jgi:hypothetical protein